LWNLEILLHMLNNLIGADARLVCQLLCERGMMTIDDIEKITGYRQMYVYLTLGWLSRENKIHYLEKNDNLYVELNK